MIAKVLVLLMIGINTQLCVAAQKIIIQQKDTARKLVWSDFTGIPDENSPHAAFTYWQLSYKYCNMKRNGDSLSVNNFVATLELSPTKSWIKNGKETNDLLIHEQGHFNLGIVCMKEVLEIMSKPILFIDDYKSSVSKLFFQILKKYQDMTLTYDEETEHSANRKAQKRWNAWFMNNGGL